MEISGSAWKWLLHLAPKAVRAIWVRWVWEPANRRADARYSRLAATWHELLKSGRKDELRRAVAVEAGTLLRRSRDRPDKLVPPLTPEQRAAHHEEQRMIAQGPVGRVFSFGVQPVEDTSIYERMCDLRDALDLRPIADLSAPRDLRVRFGDAAPTAGAQRFEAHPVAFAIKRFLLAVRSLDLR